MSDIKQLQEQIVIKLTRKYHPEDLGEPTSILESAICEAIDLAIAEERKRVVEIIENAIKETQDFNELSARIVAIIARLLTNTNK